MFSLLQPSRFLAARAAVPIEARLSFSLGLLMVAGSAAMAVFVRAGIVIPAAIAFCRN